MVLNRNLFLIKTVVGHQLKELGKLMKWHQIYTCIDLTSLDLNASTGPI